MTTAMKSLGFVIGCDLGRRQDATAVVIVERLRPVAPEAEPGDTWRSPYRVPVAETVFRIRELGKLPLGTSYDTAARAIATVAHNVACFDPDHHPRLVLDSTGVGDPLIDSLIQYLPSGVTPLRVWWTSGERIRRVGRELHVGKGWLVSRLQSLVDTRRVEIPDSPQASELLSELMSFEVQITSHGTVVAGAASGQHDDLVMSLALCVLEDDSAGPSYRPGLPFNADRPLSPDGDDWQDLHRAPSTSW